MRVSIVWRMRRGQTAPRRGAGVRRACPVIVAVRFSGFNRLATLAQPARGRKILGSMKRRPTHYGLRLTCGLALLLLPAVQHKFAPQVGGRGTPASTHRAACGRRPGAFSRRKAPHQNAAVACRERPRRGPAAPAPVRPTCWWWRRTNRGPAITSGGEVGPSASSENAGDYDGVALFWWWITPRVPLVLAGPLPDAELNGTRPYEHVSVGSILRTGPAPHLTQHLIVKPK